LHLGLLDRPGKQRFFNARLGVCVLVFLASCSSLKGSKQGDSGIVFFDDFRDNRHGWLVEDTERTRSEIRDGHYVITKKGRWGISSRTLECGLNQQEDFIVEAVIRKREGYDDFGYGVIWGANNIRDTYKFLITGEGRHIYGRTVYEDWSGMDGFETSGFVHPGNAKNKLTLKKEGVRLSLLINDNLVHETDFEAFFPNNLGFALEDGMKIEVESLVVRRLKPE
jgi:hypothetical protein